MERTLITGTLAAADYQRAVEARLVRELQRKTRALEDELSSLGYHDECREVRRAHAMLTDKLRRLEGGAR